MYQKGKKILAMLLALCMVAGVLPLTAQAALLDGDDYIEQQMYLGEDLVLHLRGNVPESYRNSEAYVTFLGQKTKYTINDMSQDEDGLYDMPIAVNVAEMTENIELELKYMGMSAIEETYSVANYLKTLIGGNYTYETQFLALELLNLGAAAQTYFGYNTSNLANKDYEIAPANAVPESVSGAYATGYVDGISFHGISVRLLSETAVRFYFQADSVEGLTFTANGAQCAVNSNENGYYIEVGGIKPKEMETEINVSVTDGENTLNVDYAPINYFIRTYHNTTDANLKNLAAAAYSYIVAAKNFVGVTPTGDFTEGVEFDNPGNVQLFSGVGGDNEWRDGLLQIMDVEGNNVLMLTCTNSAWPTFRINFGKTLKAGTTLIFDAYTNDLSGIRDTVSVFEYVSGGDATSEFAHGSWKTLNITLANDCDYVDLVFTMDRRNENIDPANFQLYMDNFVAIEPVEPEGDILEGIDFEIEGNRGLVVGQGVDQDALIRRATYEKLGISAPANGGSYALKLSHANHCWPTFRINFGTTLKAGTTVTFDVYGNFDAQADSKYMKVELTGDSKNYAVSADPNQVVWTLTETWKTATVTLTAETDHIDFMYNVNDGGCGNVASWLLIDNLKAEEPLVFTGDFAAGVGFEDKGDVVPFTGTGSGLDATVERASYADANVSAPANGGSYALKLSHANHCWPTFRINFGTTLKAGTTVTFDVYGNFDAQADSKYMKVELTGDSKNYAVSADPNQVVWTLTETWKTATVTLTAETDHIDFMYNVNDGGCGNVASWLLVDNVKAVEPVVVTNGFTFDNAAEAGAFEGITNGVAFEVVSFEDDNVLKVSHTNNCWPNFRVNFGETLKAGTTVTFDVYGNYDYAAAEGVTKYLKLELAADSKNYAVTADPNQIVWTVAEKWNTASITLTADAAYVDFFYNVADGSHGDVASWIYMDNFKTVAPDMAFKEGVTFEEESDSKYISGQGAWNDVTIERVSFDGDYAMKLTHGSSQWPALRINLGRTLPAGTVVSFDAYSYCGSMADPNSAKSLLVWKNSASQEVEMQSHYGQWTTLTVVMDTASDKIDLYWNMDQWDVDYACTEYALYLDNFVAAEPIAETLTFEYTADSAYFTDMGRSWSAANVERVAYADLGIGAPADGGEYALKLSHGNDQYPSFRINFGKTLKAGTQIKLDIYGSYSYDGENQSGCVVLYFNEPWAQVVYMGKDAWREDYTMEATLAADCTYVDLVWETRLGVDAPSFIVVDNIEFIEP